ncbi:MAG TPA: GAF domain-containing sensor histidine kinase [Thermoanaerobaculia bacterium]|nr:GAF domain-containing sensor histidine kinase [Thermoanaerobaculia bacterium]
MDDRFQHLLAINRAIAETIEYEELLRLVVDETARLTGARACALLLAGEDGTARVAASRGIDDAKVKSFAAPLDERINAALRGLLDHGDDCNFVGVPVVHHRRVTGILVVGRDGQPPPDPDEEAILAALADQAAIALDHASRYHQLWAEGQVARRELETASRRKDEFLAMLSHELRNPLSAIVNAVEVLRLASPHDPKLQQIHDIAARQAMHMKRLLDDLLDVSRVNTNRIVLARRSVALREVVREAVDSVEPAIRQRGHQLELELPEAPLLVDGDPDRLLQVVSNLLANAAKYTEPGGHVWVSLAIEDEQAVLRVRDDGIGIPADLLPHVFDLFVQAERAANRSEGGLGIGLSLVKRLVEMHGGTVVAASEGPGRGSELAVRLPLAAPLAEAPASFAVA